MGVEGKKILLGVTGGIAAYKAVELLRLLIKGDAETRVIMTEAAQKFVVPLTFETLSGHPVLLDLFSLDQDARIGHIALADQSDLMVIAPATANCLGKIASGIADDLLTTTVMALQCPVLLCPAMNVNMYGNPIVKENIERLRSLGYHILEPEEGELACGWEGKGRLVDPTEIVEEIEIIFGKKDFSGETVLITAGPTRESIDPVRFLSNFSSGRMGYAIARVAMRRGAEVILVSGPTSLPDPRGVQILRVESAQEMREAVMAHLDRATVLVKAAAVADYRPKKPVNQKIKKLSDEFLLHLERTPDILSEIGKKKGKQILVGFAAETEDLESHALEKLKEKNLDFIVANDLTQPGAGFEAETNQVKIIDRAGKIEDLPLMSKEAVAERLLDIIGRCRKS